MHRERDAPCSCLASQNRTVPPSPDAAIRPSSGVKARSDPAPRIRKRYSPVAPSQILIQFKPSVARDFPSRLYRQRMACCSLTRNDCKGSQPGTDQIVTSPLSPATASRAPSGRKAASRMMSSFVSIVRTTLPVSASQTFKVCKFSGPTSREPSGL